MAVPKTTSAKAGESPKLLYCWVFECFAVLVPKQRGYGYLRIPYGHHNNKSLNAIGDLVACDIFGLDGHLEFQCSGAIFHGPAKGRADFADRVVAALEKYYGMTAREITEPEFWRLHPIKDAAGCSAR